ncbi:MAG: four helix bundle protein [Gemmatimonadota bacterium]|nr:MAG: four helix bundle protein [Gemmatimonadota bacterium]
MQQRYDLEERLIEFAVAVCAVSGRLPRTRVANHVAGQLIRCATAPAPNYAESQSAESRRDFVHKLRICLKELRETHVWLRLIKRLNLSHGADVENALREANELISILVTSVETARRSS